MKNCFILGALLSVHLLAINVGAADARWVIPLWAGGAPGSAGKNTEEKVRLSEIEHEHVVSSIHHPSLTVFLPTADTATGAAVVICPGGGHRELWMDHEGYNVGRWLASHGIAGFVLKYRLAREEGSTYAVGIHSFADVQRAIRLVRSHAAEWKIDPSRVGVMGFSAGGEVAALAGMNPAAVTGDDADLIDRQDAKPAFQALIYPGNSDSMTPAKDSPPAFLVCGYGDRADISEGLVHLYLRFKQMNVPAELHIYTGVGHGFGLRENNHPPSGLWPERFREWLQSGGLLDKTPLAVSSK